MKSVAVPAKPPSWSGGEQPFGISHAKMGMWLFIGSDSLTFAALLFGYGYLRNASPDWPRPFEAWPAVAVATGMTLCLLASSVTMALATRSARDGRPRAAVRAIGATFGLGLAFLMLHLGEWGRLAAEGVTPSHNPWGAPLFGGTFYTLTGLHMLHVIAGLVALAVVASRFARGRTSAEGVVVCALYWHFVELVWMFLFPLVYLTSVHPGGGG